MPERCYSAEITARILRNRPDLLARANGRGKEEPRSDACPNCQAPLIDGDCWACLI